MSDETIQFIQNHRPALNSGDYLLEVTLANPAAPADRQPKISRPFTIAGDRFAFKPGDIQAVFPPAGSQGDHSNVLPHVILNRSTLPWERRALSENEQAPWLALLLFDEQEAPKCETYSLNDIGEPYRGFQLETGQTHADQVTVIVVPRASLAKILPAAEVLQYLAHVRKAADGTECAVVIGSRLPQQGRTSTVHLVSLEKCYHLDPKIGKGVFNDPENGQQDTVRLISLWNWHFKCQDQEQTFSRSVSRLDCRTLRLPENPNVDAEQNLALGSVLLAHHLPQGDQTLHVHSWYHGPLLPGRNLTKESDLVLPPPGNVARASGQALLPALGSASLKRYNPALGLLDVSYAAAWELGRFLALQSSTFSTELFSWKRSRKWKLQQAGAKLTRLFPAAASSKPGLPPVVISWFERLERLEGVPFNYLVPDKRLLPDESLRLFSLDWFWMECLQDGALSIGRVTKADRDLDQAVKTLLDQSLGAGHLSRSASQVTGFLLRSEVVSGWPGLLVNGYGKTGAGTLLLTRRLATDILLCLFTGELARFEISLKAESMNFGVDGTDPSNFGKKHRDKAGNAASQGVPIPWCNAAPDQRVIDIPKLAQALRADNSAQFAFQMIEGVEKVSFELH